MGTKLTWVEIKENYPNEWIELVDYEWDETEPDPRLGVVLVHSKDRKEFESLIRKESPNDSAILYVGKIEIPVGMTVSSNQNQFMKSS